MVSHEDRAGFAAVCAAFERLYADPAVVALDAAWIERYRARRPALRPALHQADDAGEPLEAEDEPLGPALPDDVQREALDALADTRADGNAAGLVVLATGMGKTFLGAFDSAEFSRVLFVAHREEILKPVRECSRARFRWPSTGAAAFVKAQCRHGTPSARHQSAHAGRAARSDRRALG